MAQATPEQACAHPNWSMGRKISVDSATMMNKGLELIEASYLFGLPESRLDVLVHPQSIVHSMVEYEDGSMLAQLGNPDMRTPIAHALAHPERIDSGVAPLSLAAIGRLDFEAPDLQRFPCLRLAHEALRAGGAAPCVLNAANEVAVTAFLERSLRFTDIARVAEAALQAVGSRAAGADVEQVLELDREARALARDQLIAVRRMSTLQTLVAFLAALTLLIFVHELGHYLVARRCDVKVLRFSIGFGRPLFTWRVGRDRTEWTIAAVPLGGYVRMLDERDAAAGPIPVDELPRAFTRKTLGQRSAIVIAGPLANFLLAIAIYAGMGWVGTEEPAAVIDQPASGTPAAAARLRGGDRVLEVDGSAVRSWNEVRLKLLEPVIERRASALRVARDGATAIVNVDAGGLPADEAERDFLRSLGLRLAPGMVVIANLVAGSAAERDGLRAGDQLLAIAGSPVRRASDVIERVQASAGKPLGFAVTRGRDELTISVTPDAVQPADGNGATARDRPHRRRPARPDPDGDGALRRARVHRAGRAPDLGHVAVLAAHAGQDADRRPVAAQPERAGDDRRPCRAVGARSDGSPTRASWR